MRISAHSLIADSTVLAARTGSDGKLYPIFTRSAILSLETNFIEKFSFLLRHTNGYGLFKCSSEFVTWLGWTGTLKNDFEMRAMNGVVFPFQYAAWLEFDQGRIRVRLDGVQMDNPTDGMRGLI
jgi:hypothetical protein